MKKEDFKDIFNPRFLETANKFIKSKGRCNVINGCDDCPFNYQNNINNKHCSDGTRYVSKTADSTEKDPTLVRNAKEFIKMVEEEKEKQFLEEFFNGKFENGVLKVMGGMAATEPNFKKMTMGTAKVELPKEEKSPLAELTERIKNKEVILVPYHSGRGHYFITVKGMNELAKRQEFARFEREYLQKWWNDNSEEEKVEKELKYYKNASVNTINKVVTMELENGKIIEDRAVKYYFEFEGDKFKGGDIEGLDGFYRFVGFKPKNSIVATIVIDTTKADEAIGKVKEKLEELKEQAEHFELKEGMRFKTIDKSDWSEDLRRKVFTVAKKQYVSFFNGVGYKIAEFPTWFSVDEIDWKETRKLNEVKEEPKEEPKKSITITLDLNKQQELLNRTTKALEELNNCIEAIEKDFLLKDKIKIKVEVESVE